MAIVNDRIPTQPNRKKITNESTGTVEYATVEYADNPTVVGTPINKALFDQVQFWEEETEEIPKCEKYYLKKFYHPNYSLTDPNKFICLLGADDVLVSIYRSSSDNYISISPDNGETWKRIPWSDMDLGFGSIPSPYCFTFADGIIAGIAQEGKVVYSGDNGTTWQLSNTGTSCYYSITNYNGTWYTGNRAGRISKSTNLQNWSTTNVFSNNRNNDVYVFSSPNGLIACSIDDAINGMAYNLDGTTWHTTNNRPGVAMNGSFPPQFVFFKGKWYGAGIINNMTGISISETGQTWTDHEIEGATNSSTYPMIFCDDEYLYCSGKGQSELHRSSNGTDWELVSPALLSQQVYLYGAGNPVGITNDGSFFFGGFYNNTPTIFFTNKYKEKNIKEKNNEEEKFPGNALKSIGNYVSTGSQQYIYTDFVPQSVYVTYVNTEKVTTTISAIQQSTADIYLQPNGALILATIPAGNRVDYMMIG